MSAETEHTATSRGNRVTRPRTYRTTPKLAAAIQRAASAAGLTEAAWVRQTLAEVIAEDIAIEDQKPVKKRRSRPRPSVEVIAIRGLREVCGEAVGTLRQVAGIDRARGGARLVEIDRAIDQLIGTAAFLDEANSQLIKAAE